MVIEQGTVGAVALSIALDNEIEPDESLVIKLDQPENAVIGMVDQRTVTIVEDNIAPELELVVTQDGRQGRLVTADGGLITVNARFTDLNPDDSHTVDWAADTLDLVGVTADGAELTIDPSALTLDLIPLAATVSDDGAPILSSSADTLLRRLLSAPDLDSAADTDGDGASDANEGFGDADGDGIPDYLDNIDETYLVPAGPAQGQIMQAAMGNIIRLGDCAFALGAEGVWIDQSQLGEAPCEPDPNNVYPSGLFDFQVSGDQQGEAYNLVLPLSSVIPENASVRTYLGDSIGWQDFTLNAFNAVSSALAVDGACPAPGSDLYSDGLTVGANCLQLSIEDGGPNDIGAAVDGTVTHFSGIAIENIEDSVAPEPVPIPTQVQSSSGGGCTVAASGAPADGSLLLLLLLGLLRMVREKIKLGELKAVA
ncbi:MAG: thrombospondin type 3 repeat-containing protein [Porticoccaceae bacterium]|nr:thrombospondin type 3 repeat-containing protein [Porticoccaceae bacterium]